jgi:feruloyl esterase
MMWSLTIARRLAAPGGALPTAKIALLDNAQIASCDDDDGAADGIIGNPAACGFDAASLRCAGADGSDCLTDGELATIALIRADVTLQHAQADGITSFATLEPGHESDFFAWPIWLTEGFPNEAPPRPPLGYGGLEQFLRYIVTGDPALDALKFDPADHLGALERESLRIDATDADLGPYFASGGKLILWHGRVDSVLPIGITHDYVARVRAATGAQADDSLRYYTAPGVTHCQWGPGADTVDLVTPLDAWVSNGTPPGTPVARRYPLGPDGRPQVDQTPYLSRPLCPYPEYPHYNGAGDMSDAASFSCRVP